MLAIYHLEQAHTAIVSAASAQTPTELLQLIDAASQALAAAGRSVESIWTTEARELRRAQGATKLERKYA